MDQLNPLRLFSPTVDVEVLAALAGVDTAMTGNQLAGVIPDRSVQGVRDAAERLVRHGIVTKESVGRAYLYAFNRDHVAAVGIQAVLNSPALLVERLRAAVRQWTHAPVYAALFGSAARGAMRADSDLDLFLVRPESVADADWSEQLLQLQLNAFLWSGNDVRPISLRPSDLASGKWRERYVADVDKEGVHLAGDAMFLRNMIRNKGRTP